ncbi:MAG: phage tail tube protein [Patescibacteria group bacterium]|nr:phage tail tube protein [Patescibacteria group bacterium]
MKGIGKLFQLGITKEAVRGTAEAATTYWIPWSELSIDEADAKVADEQSRGVIEDSVGAEIVKQWAEGNLTAPIADKHFPLVLLSALGSIASAIKETTAYNHTVTVQQGAQHQSLTLFVDDPLGAQDYKHALGVVQSLQIRYERDKFIDYVVSLLAKKGATATLTPANTTENRFLPQHLTFKLAANLAGLDAAQATKVKLLTLTIDKNLESDDVLGNKEPEDFLNKQLTISGEVEAIWENETDFKNAAVAGTPKAMRIDLKNSDVTIGASSNPQIKIDLAKVVFEPVSRAITLGDIVTQRLAFKAHYSISDSKMIEIVATNEVTSY